jgi:hypothetical protein
LAEQRQQQKKTLDDNFAGGTRDMQPCLSEKQAKPWIITSQ